MCSEYPATSKLSPDVVCESRDSHNPLPYVTHPRQIFCRVRCCRWERASRARFARNLASQQRRQGESGIQHVATDVRCALERPRISVPTVSAVALAASANTISAPCSHWTNQRATCSDADLSVRYALQTGRSAMCWGLRGYSTLYRLIDSFCGMQIWLTVNGLLGRRPWL